MYQYLKMIMLLSEKDEYTEIFVVVNLQEKLHDWMMSVKSSIDRSAKSYKEQEYVLTEGEYLVLCFTLISDCWIN